MDNHVRNLERELIGRIEDFACFLIGSKPTMNTSHELRFGRKGSLSIQKMGLKAGCFKDFDSGDGGDIFGLIMSIQGCSFREAIQEAEKFLGGSYGGQRSVKMPEQRSFFDLSVLQSQPWTQVSPVPRGVKIPTTKDIENNPYLNFMLKDGKRIECLHVYRIREGLINYLVVRLLDLEGNKVTLPLTLHRHDRGFYAWKWKGLSGPRPLFGLEKLGLFPDHKVLIVEGEKTAEATQLLYPDLVVLTWPNGVSATHKSDWSVLVDKDVVIWPDNDAGGMRAARNIQDILRNLNSGKERVGIVFVPTEFPEKWDFADPFPKGWNGEKTRKLIEEVFEKRDGVVSKERVVFDLKRNPLSNTPFKKKQNKPKAFSMVGQFKKEQPYYVERCLKFPTRWQ